VKRCGSVWTCPICAARITEKKRKELKQALEDWIAQGGKVFLLTLTIPHHGGQQTAVWRDQLLSAYRKMRNRTSWREWAKSIGLHGSVRALEVTYPRSGVQGNGAHIHIHLLLFCLPAASTRLPRASDVLTIWQSACVAVGLEEPNTRGVDLRDGSYAANYVGKWGLDFEMTKAHCKRGRADRWTPWDLLNASADGDEQAGRLFVEYAYAFFGQRQLEWSSGLRTKLGLAKEKSDKVLAKEATERAELVAEIPPDDWQRVVLYEAHADVLIAAKANGGEGVKLFLRDLEIRACHAPKVWRC
jgi:hypothetical protein